MIIKEPAEIVESVENINIDNINRTICKNMRRLRLAHYEAYKKEHNKATGIYNSYSTDNIALSLGMSKVHYKRLENENDHNKHITLEKLLILSIIYDVDINEFFKEI